MQVSDAEPELSKLTGVSSLKRLADLYVNRENVEENGVEARFPSQWPLIPLMQRTILDQTPLAPPICLRHRLGFRRARVHFALVPA